MLQLNQKPLKQDWLNSVTFRYATPIGTAWVQIFEKSTGKVEHIFLSVGKAGSSLNAMCFAISELVGFCLRKGHSMAEVIALLSGITTDKKRKIKGVDVSGPIDALLMALIQYRASIPEELHREQLGKVLRKVR